MRELDAQTAAELALEEWFARDDACDCVTCIVREVLIAADPYLCRSPLSPTDKAP